MYFTSCLAIFPLFSVALAAAVDVATVTATVSGACQWDYTSTIVLTAPIATATVSSPETTTITEDISIVWKEKRAQATKTVTTTVCTPYTDTIWPWTTDSAYTSTQTNYAATSTAYVICGEGLPPC
jgi:hypothetical protein